MPPNACLVPALLALAGQPALGQERVPMPEGARNYYACEAPGSVRLEAREMMRWDVMTDDEAFVAFSVRIHEQGSLAVADADGVGVYFVSRDGETVRKIGREGEGPGEYRRPVDVSHWGPEGGVAVADQAANSLVLFDQLGRAVRTVRVQHGTISGVAADETYVYVSLVVVSGADARVRQPGGLPILVRYDPRANEWESVLTVDRSRVGERPFYHFSMVQPMVRAGLDGHVYLGFKESYEIWRVEGTGQAATVVRGCIPEELERSYRSTIAEGVPRQTMRFLSDFTALADGRVAVRVAIQDRDGRRATELYALDGRRLGSWLVDRTFASTAFAAIHPARPFSIQVSFSPIQGVTQVLALQGGPSED